MKIAVIGANGKAGRLIVKEALDRGLDVTAVVRHPNQSLAEKVIEKDLFALTQDDIKDFDVIVDAFGVSAGEDPKLHILSLEHLIKLLTGTKIRLLVVGGAGSLYLNPEHTMQVQDAEDFPEAYKPVASNMAKALEELRQHKDLAWTYVTPRANASNFLIFFNK